MYTQDLAQSENMVTISSSGGGGLRNCNSEEAGRGRQRGWGSHKCEAQTPGEAGIAEGRKWPTVADAAKTTEERFGGEEVTDHLGQGSLRRVTGTEASKP